MSEPSKKKAEEKADEEFILTPEIMRHENRRNDLILALGVGVFAFFLCTYTETVTDIWLRLRTGQLISESFPSVPAKDTLTYTAEGRTWVNPSWLFDWVIYSIYTVAGDKALTVFKALFGVIAGVSILWIRYPGPTLWWSTLVAIPMLVAMSVRFSLSPEIVTFALLGFFLNIWFQYRHRNKGWAVWLCIPLSAAWGNIDLTYVIIPILLALLAMGEGIQSFLPERLLYSGKRLTAGRIWTLWGIAFLCLLMGAATPYGWQTVEFPLFWYQILGLTAVLDRLLSGWESLEVQAFMIDLQAGRLLWTWNAWIFLIASGLASFVLNLRHLNVGRVLLFLFGVVTPMFAARLVSPAAMILAYVLTLNGQEFFLGRYGSEPRISTGWWLWSIVGRAVSILTVVFFILAACTGRVQSLVGRFGFGFNMDRYMVDGAEYLKNLKPEGRAFAFSYSCASYCAWAVPGYKNFADTRWQVVAPYLISFNEMRRAIMAGRLDVLKEDLDKYGITHILIDPQDAEAANSVLNLLEVPSLAPLYVSDQVVIVGRIDENKDQALFKEKAIEANRLVFRDRLPPPLPTERFVEPPGWIDQIWRTRQVLPTGMIAASVYLSGANALPTPGTNYLGIREARNAVSRNPDSSLAQLELARAYLRTYNYERLVCLKAAKEQEKTDSKGSEKSAGTAAVVPGAAVSSLPKGPSDLVKEVEAVTPPSKPEEKALPTEAGVLAGGGKSVGTTVPPPPTEESQIPPRYLLLTRHYQAMAALRNSIHAGAMGSSPDMEMYRFCLLSDFVDMALTHLRAALNRMPAAEVLPLRAPERVLEAEVFKRKKEFDRLIELREKQLKEAGVDSDRPIERADLALRLGLVQLAVDELDRESPIGPEMAEAAPFVIGVNMLVGNLQKAQDRLITIKGSPALPPGEWDFLMSQIRLGNGQLNEARDHLEHAIAEVRGIRAGRSLSAMETRVRMGRVINFPFEINQSLSEIEREANYWFILGLVRIELGEPSLMPQAFAKTLMLSPHFTLRPVIEYYWPLATKEKLEPEPPAVDLTTQIAREFPVEAEAEKKDESKEKDDGKEPETKEPETKEPETKEPETKEPETKEPETKEPETKPEANPLGAPEKQEGEKPPAKAEEPSPAPSQDPSSENKPAESPSAESPQEARTAEKPQF
ncbi:MAG: hypothetical protein U1D30_09210 [Planctomycetota bacterium]